MKQDNKGNSCLNKRVPNIPARGTENSQKNLVFYRAAETRLLTDSGTVTAISGPGVDVWLGGLGVARRES